MSQTMNLVAQLLDLPEPQRTYLEILQVHDKEVPMENLLAYFFRDKEQHELKDSFIKALLKTKCFELDVKNYPTSVGSLISQGFSESDQQSVLESIRNVQVHTEVRTGDDNDSDKRIDILIDTKSFVICIEFKINHTLNNPLDVYENHIFKVYGNSGKRIFYVVLTPSKKTPDVEDVQGYLVKNRVFKQVLLNHFFKMVVEEVPSDVRSSSAYHHFEDLVQTIQNREIRHKRFLLLKELEKFCLGRKIDFSYHENRKGGFLQVEKPNRVMKLRIEERQFQIESWVGKNKTIIQQLPLTTPFDLLVKQVQNVA